MPLTDEERKNLRELIQNKFTEQRLKDILTENEQTLKRNLYDVVEGDTYQSKLINLVRYLDQNDLINTFLKILGNENQNFCSEIEKQAIVKLKHILQPLKEQYFKQIQQSYFDSLSAKFGDWIPTLNSIEDIFQEIQNIHEKEASLKSIVRFVVRLLNIHVFSDEINGQLTDWGRDNIDNFDQIREKIKQDIRREQEIYLEIYLIILIQPSIQSNNLYIVKGWLIEYNSQTNIRCNSKLLDVNCQIEEPLEFKQIPYLLNDFIEQSGRPIKAIEFLLPYQLFNEPVENFKPIEENGEEKTYSIGVMHIVNIRSYTRIKKLLKNSNSSQPQNILNWHKKWQELHKYKFIEQDNCVLTLKEIPEIPPGELAHVLCVKLFQIPSKQILKAIDETGTPIALWLRTDERNSDFTSDFSEICQSSNSILQISKKIKEERITAFNKENHIGKHITLLWDNPNTLPEIVPASLP